MKKIIGTLLLYFILLCSCSGFNNQYVQYFIEGDFVGSKYYRHDVEIKDRATLSIKNISKEEFDAADGVDVVKDYNGGQNPYFSICFKVKDENDEYQDFHFYNLELDFAGYCLYIDTSKHSIAPHSRLAEGIDTIVYTINHEIPIVFYCFSFGCLCFFLFPFFLA